MRDPLLLLPFDSFSPSRCSLIPSSDSSLIFIWHSFFQLLFFVLLFSCFLFSRVFFRCSLWCSWLFIFSFWIDPHLTFSTSLFPFIRLSILDSPRLMPSLLLHPQRIHGIFDLSRGETCNDALLGSLLPEPDSLGFSLADRRNAIRSSCCFLFLASNDGNQIHEIYHLSWFRHWRMASLHRIHIFHFLGSFLHSCCYHSLCFWSTLLTPKGLRDY